MLPKKLQHFWIRFWRAWQSGGVWSALSVGWRDLATTMSYRLRPLSNIISSQIYQLIYFLYYSLVFGRHLLGDQRISSIIHALERRQNKGDISVGKEDWELQYLGKMWNYLSNCKEVSHYSVIVGYIQYFKPTGSILDIGCGEGILQARLTASGYARYVGIDISDAAIQKAHLREDEKTIFISGDADSYIPPELFDVIIFNEVLYYFDYPLESFARYMEFLKENGMIITSLFQTIRSNSIRRRIKEMCPAVVETKVTNTFKSLTWFCNVFAPSEKIQLTRSRNLGSYTLHSSTKEYYYIMICR